jgi:hypothetical protein
MLVRRAQEAADASARHVIATGRLREEFGLDHIGDVSVNYLPGRLPSDRVEGAGGTLQISARAITSDGMMPAIGRAFSGAPLLGYQFRSDGAQGLTGEIWAHHPTLETALVERLAGAQRRATCSSGGRRQGQRHLLHDLQNKGANSEAGHYQPGAPGAIPATSSVVRRGHAVASLREAIRQRGQRTLTRRPSAQPLRSGQVTTSLRGGSVDWGGGQRLWSPGP